MTAKGRMPIAAAKQIFLLSSFACALAGHWSPAAAAEPNWSAAESDYVIVNQDLRAVLTEISNQLGLAAFVSDDIRGKISRPPSDGNTKALIERLGKLYGFTWYYDGGKIYYSSLKESTSAVFQIGQLSFDSLKRQLAQLQILDDRFELRFSEAGRSVFVSGPPRYVELVRQGIDAANAQIVNRQQAPGVVVIYGSGSR